MGNAHVSIDRDEKGMGVSETDAVQFEKVNKVAPIGPHNSFHRVDEWCHGHVGQIYDMVGKNNDLKEN